MSPRCQMAYLADLHGENHLHTLAPSPKPPPTPSQRLVQGRWERASLPPPARLIAALLVLSSWWVVIGVEAAPLRARPEKHFASRPTSSAAPAPATPTNNLNRTHLPA